MKKVECFFYGMFFLAFGIQVWYAMSDTLTFTTIQKIGIVTIQVVNLLLGSFFSTKNASKEKKWKENQFLQVILFLLFVGNLGYLLFFDSDFGRTNHYIEYGFIEYFNDNVNLVPLDTIHLYITALEQGLLSWQSVAINLIGNIVAFTPFAYFLPLFFKAQRKVIVFFLTMLVIIVSIEITQVIMQSGAGDVDDLILNMVGVISVYILLKIPFIKARVYGESANGKSK